MGRRKTYGPNKRFNVIRPSLAPTPQEQTLRAPSSVNISSKASPPLCLRKCASEPRNDRTRPTLIDLRTKLHHNAMHVPIAAGNAIR